MTKADTKRLLDRIRDLERQVRAANGGERAMARWLTATQDDNAKMRHAIFTFVAIQDEYLEMHRSTKTKVPRAWRDAYRRLKKSTVVDVRTTGTKEAP